MCCQLNCLDQALRSCVAQFYAWLSFITSVKQPFDYFLYNRSIFPLLLPSLNRLNDNDRWLYIMCTFPPSHQNNMMLYQPAVHVIVFFDDGPLNGSSELGFFFLVFMSFFDSFDNRASVAANRSSRILARSSSDKSVSVYGSKLCCVEVLVAAVVLVAAAAASSAVPRR